MNNRTKKLLVVSLAPTILKDGKYWSYAPYVNEMDVWFKYAEEHRILAPFSYPEDVLIKPFSTETIERYYVPFFAFNSLVNVIKALVCMPLILFQMIRAMAWADHIHLRCPANVSLVACFVQILFPWKQKSAKYAGNWDPDSKQPWTYRLQQAILKNTFLTHNMKVLVYGKWPNTTKNIKPFYTATYTEEEKIPYQVKDYSKALIFVYAGMLVPGKQPLLAIQFIESLNNHGISSRLELFGDGPLRSNIEDYVSKNGLFNCVNIHGNQDKSVVKTTLLSAHFNILLSKSEGWPKAVAEGMFFGCIPVTTAVSCVAWMLGEGERGIIVPNHLDAAVSHFKAVYATSDLEAMSKNALCWSQQYTVDRFESDIEKLLGIKKS
ncbi:glycosyltransferase (GT4) [Formosa agariphila KMM 3901]|uniref:Glycosyltransferase (GT4) n=1 Tax=Formosa agariphila (strain DSM 15362 / KCTC 12365 / LMG 23005 / KMM 3901 / M-2Alg 35-1) TaxID=1347342 RepID=T2KNH9_FORAG|nr:glycosyltransferase [Formosa agariphila]CDF80023.1 glycosyltransferase (GT4) [Formosa agariphila KMM 3901]